VLSNWGLVAEEIAMDERVPPEVFLPSERRSGQMFPAILLLLIMLRRSLDERQERSVHILREPEGEGRLFVLPRNTFMVEVNSALSGAMGLRWIVVSDSGVWVRWQVKKQHLCKSGREGCTGVHLNMLIWFSFAHNIPARWESPH